MQEAGNMFSEARREGSKARPARTRILPPKLAEAPRAYNIQLTEGRPKQRKAAGDAMPRNPAFRTPGSSDYTSQLARLGGVEPSQRVGNNAHQLSSLTRAICGPQYGDRHGIRQDPKDGRRAHLARERGTSWLIAEELVEVSRDRRQQRVTDHLAEFTDSKKPKDTLGARSSYTRVYPRQRSRAGNRFGCPQGAQERRATGAPIPGAKSAT